MFARYRSVFSLPGTARLFASALVGRMPQGMSALAILLLIRDTTHSYAAAGAAVGVNAFAAAACAPIAGRLVDRWGRDRVLAPFAVVQAGVYVALVVAADDRAGNAALILLAGLAGSLLPPIAPVVRVVLGEVFEDPAVRDRAYAVESILQELIWIAGPGVVAAVVAVLSPSAAVAMLGLFGVLGTATFLRGSLLRSSPRRVVSHARRSALRSRELRALLGPIALTGLCLGAIEVGLPSLALHVGSRSDAGLLLALWSVGSISGGLWYGGRDWRSPLSSRYRQLLVVLVVCTAPLVAARSIAAGAACAVLAGVAIAPLFSCQYALVGRASRTGSETEAFTWSTGALIGGVAAGSAGGGAVIGAGGVSAPFVLACAAAVLAAAIAASSRVRLESEPRRAFEAAAAD